MTGIELPTVTHNDVHNNSPNTKRLSFWTIVVIAANTMNGPGLTTLPAVSYAAGKLTLVVLILLSTFLTSYVVKRLCVLMWTKQRDVHTSSMHLHNSSTNITGDDDLMSDKSHNHHSEDHEHYTPLLEESDMVALSGDIWTQPHQRPAVRRVASIAMVGCALALALAQMMLCAKIADAMIVASFGSVCGVNMSPTSILFGDTSSRLHCTSNLSMQPFAPIEERARNLASLPEPDGAVIIEIKKNNRPQQIPPTTPSTVPPMSLLTGGLVIAAAITISLASVDLDSMLTAQFFLFGCLLLACLRFCYTLTHIDKWSVNIKSVGAGGGYSFPEAPLANLIKGPRPFDAVGPVLFNFAFVVTAPPLSCGAQGGLQTAIQALVTACVIMGTLYSILGWVGASAAAIAEEENDDTNLLSLVLRGTPTKWDHLSVIVFGISQLAAIPVYCELAHETLQTHVQIFATPRYNFLLCHVAPWLICALTYNSALFESFVEWSSLLLLGFCNFSLPLLLDISWIKQQQQHLGHTTKSTRKTTLRMGWVVWMFGMVTATITAVIVQRMTASAFLAEGAFMCTVLLILNYF